jgi:hypothetical protein
VVREGVAALAPAQRGGGLPAAAPLDGQMSLDKLDFRAFLEAAGVEFQARIDRARFYQHPTGVGDAREDVVRQYLQEVLSRRFCVYRGKIFDSDGNLSREFDVIISEADGVAPAMTLAGRRIVPIEAVYGVIEIKSALDREGYDSFITAVTDLDQMKRHYQPLQPIRSNDSAALQAGLSAQDRTAGRIWSGIIAFEAPGGRTLADYFASRCEGFWFICVPGREFVTQWTNPPGCAGPPYGFKSLPMAVWLIMEYVNSSNRPRLLVPNFSRYRQRIVEAIGDLPDAWRAEFEGAP